MKELNRGKLDALPIDEIFIFFSPNLKKSYYAFGEYLIDRVIKEGKISKFSDVLDTKETDFYRFFKSILTINSKSDSFLFLKAVYAIKYVAFNDGYLEKLLEVITGEVSKIELSNGVITLAENLEEKDGKFFYLDEEVTVVNPEFPFSKELQFITKDDLKEEEVLKLETLNKDEINQTQFILSSLDFLYEKEPAKWFWEYLLSEEPDFLLYTFYKYYHLPVIAWKGCLDEEIPAHIQALFQDNTDIIYNIVNTVSSKGLLYLFTDAGTTFTIDEFAEMSSYKLADFKMVDNPESGEDQITYDSLLETCNALNQNQYISDEEFRFSFIENQIASHIFNCGIYSSDEIDLMEVDVCLNTFIDKDFVSLTEEGIVAKVDNEIVRDISEHLNLYFKENLILKDVPISEKLRFFICNQYILLFNEKGEFGYNKEDLTKFISWLNKQGSVDFFDNSRNKMLETLGLYIGEYGKYFVNDTTLVTYNNLVSKMLTKKVKVSDDKIKDIVDILSEYTSEDITDIYSQIL